jgi:hypothetical protein
MDKFQSIVFFFVLRHSVQVAGNGTGTGYGGINVCDETGAVFRIASIEKEEIGDVVGAEDGL